jgi:plasmid maintenance system antidote protein VapI
MTTTKPKGHPLHTGEFIREIDLSELQISIRDVASKLKVAPSTLTRNTGSYHAWAPTQMR